MPFKRPAVTKIDVFKQITVSLLVAILSSTTAALKGTRIQAQDSRGRHSASSSAGVAAARAARVRRGINLSHWFSQSTTGEYSEKRLLTYVTRQDMLLIKRMGFDHVRLPIDAALLSQSSDPTHLDAPMMAHLNAALDAILATGLSVIVDMHPEDSFKLKLRTDDAHVEAFAVFWRTFAAQLAERDPERLYLEILNEPMVEDPYRWSGIQSRIAAEIRAAAPRHTIIATGARWSAIDQLLLSQPLADKNVIYNFHFYEPHTFTHQGATWGAAYWPFLKNIPYPSSPDFISPLLPAIQEPSAREALRDYGDLRWNGERIESEVALAADWAAKHGVPLICDEFGAYRAFSPAVDRLRWIEDVRLALEKRGIGWTMWDYAGSFGVAVRENGHVVRDPKTEGALGLPVSVKTTKNSH